MVKNIVLSKKTSNIVGGLAPKRRGDYVIVRQIGDNVFEVADCNGEIVREYQSSQLEHLVPSSFSSSSYLFLHIFRESKSSLLLFFT